MAASRLIKWPTHLAITVDVIFVNAESIDNVHEVDSTIYDSEGTAAEAKTHVRSRMPPREGAYIVTQAPPATSPLRFNINDPENMRLFPEAFDGTEPDSGQQCHALTDHASCLRSLRRHHSTRRFRCNPITTAHSEHLQELYELPCSAPITKQHHNRQVSNARYVFDYAYRVRRGIAVDSQAIRYKNSHLGAWILPTERDRDQPPPDPTNSDRSSSSRRTSAPSALSTSASHAQQSLPPSAAASTSGQTAPTTQIVASTSATRPEQPASIPAHNDLTASYQQQPHTSTPPYQPEASTSDIRMDVDTEGFEVIYSKLRVNPDQHHDDSTDSDRLEWQIPPALHKGPKAAEGESPFYKQRRLRNVNHPI
ncbi:hypothetical protein CF319_g7447 [Tilletia indica]|nr:hypothetical protein CF319_g7447 [Tilletia indica]